MDNGSGLFGAVKLVGVWVDCVYEEIDTQEFVGYCGGINSTSFKKCHSWIFQLLSPNL